MALSGCHSKLRFLLRTSIILLDPPSIFRDNSHTEHPFVWNEHFCIPLLIQLFLVFFLLYSLSVGTLRFIHSIKSPLNEWPFNLPQSKDNKPPHLNHLFPFNPLILAIIPAEWYSSDHLWLRCWLSCSAEWYGGAFHHNAAILRQ